MTAPTALDLADAISRIHKAAELLQGAASKAGEAIQAAVGNVEEAASRFDLNDLDDELDPAAELAAEVAKLHADEHDGPLRWCSRLACRMADEVVAP